MRAAKVADTVKPDVDKDDAKALGAFYTDVQIADFLVWWAVRVGKVEPGYVSVGGEYGGKILSRAIPHVPFE